MRVFEPLLGIDELMRITGLSRVSIYRKVAAARANQNQSRFPVPLSDRKERLKWSAASVEAYCQTQPVLPPPVIVASPSKQAKAMKERRANTEAILAGHGMKLNSTK